MVASRVTDGLRTEARTEPLISAEDVAWIAALPKAELHLHLSGSLRPETALRLARQQGRFTELDDQTLTARLRAPDFCADQAELLDAFAMPSALLQDEASLSLVAAELVADLAAEGTRYAEIRFAPANPLHPELRPDGAIDAVIAGVARGRRMLAKPPHIGLIAIAMRTAPTDVSVAVAQAAAARRADGVVGFDLAGLEASAPLVEPHLAAFEIARAAGLGVSIHAGEWGGAAQVRTALLADPDRIAHGGPAADDPALMDELLERGITLDLCPTSNVQAGLVPTMADHPLPRLYQAGVPVTVSTDDRTVSATSLTRELALAMDPLGLARIDLLALTRRALEVAFLHDTEDARASLLSELESYAEETT